jgi:hypothetical protein
MRLEAVSSRLLSVASGGKKKLSATSWHNYPIDLEGEVDKSKIARSMVISALVRRKSDQQINIVLLFSSVGMAALILGGYFFLIRGGLNQLDTHSRALDVTRTAIAERFESVPGFVGGVVSYDDPSLATLTIMPTVTPTPYVVVFNTPTPTLMPGQVSYDPVGLPTSVLPTIVPGASEYIFSFYNPDILAPGDVVKGVCQAPDGKWCHTVNCWDFDIMKGVCVSKMFSGLDFHAWYGKAVACPEGVPMGAVYRVLAPEQIRGDWVCLDRGGAVSGTRLDFLLLKMPVGINFGDIVIASLIIPEGVK